MFDAYEQITAFSRNLHVQRLRTDPAWPHKHPVKTASSRRIGPFRIIASYLDLTRIMVCMLCSSLCMFAGLPKASQSWQCGTGNRQSVVRSDVRKSVLCSSRDDMGQAKTKQVDVCA